MSKFILIIFCFLSVKSLTFSQEKIFPEKINDYIENPGKFSLNQERGHTPLVAFSSINEALENKWESSGAYLSLNGDWKFKWSENPDKSPKDFFLEKYNDKNWDNLPVPSNWEMHGYGDPMFRNVNHPFRTVPPFVPRDYNPVGSYRKTFSLPANWKGRQVFLRMEAASSASFVWVNGKEAGYNAGANEPAEYNITKYLKPGKNTIAVNVYKYSAGTYLEDQDMWRLAGIFREVYLFATPEVHLRDYYVTTDLDNNYRDATMNIVAEIANYASAKQGGYSIRATLFNTQRQIVVKNILSPQVSANAGQTQAVNLSVPVTNPDKWSDEKPNLYFLTLELLNVQGKVTEVISGKIGFKKTEVKHQALYVNGVPVKLNGVNSHMQHPLLGHTMDKETIRKDMLLMKQFNINCVRTSHYPPTVDYLNMADEMGLYIVDETGDEAHATPYLSELPEWRDAYVDRVQGMVLRDRNHPSIIFWSAGNESGIGNNICEVIKEGKRLDPPRIFMYGGNTDDWAYKNEVPCEDIIGPRYPTPFELLSRICRVPENQGPRPSFMDEYLSVEGNGGGGLDEYWDVIYNCPRCIGGAIWDWVSPGIVEKIRFVTDKSKNNINIALKGNCKIVPGQSGQAIALSGFDQWIDVYRHPALDITGNQLSLSARIFVRDWNTDGTYITKGKYQYGLQQPYKDSLEFYLTTKEKNSLMVPLPANWENKWHQVAGIYDGKTMTVLADGTILGSKLCSGNITNKPFPVNIGRNAETEGQEYSGRNSNALFDHVSIFDKAIPYAQLTNPGPQLIGEALLWLDFDEVQDKGTMFGMGTGGRTYGLVWPDRTPQPELWQVKKSAQPVKTTWVNPEAGIVEIKNRYHFTNLSELQLRWELQANGKVIQNGVLDTDLLPLQKKQLTIPFSKPVITETSEYRLLISVSLKTEKPWASSGFEVAWNQLELPWKKLSMEASAAIDTARITYNESTENIKITGDGFEYIFEKQYGRMVSMMYHGKQLINEGPRFNVWRAPLANELDNWAQLQSHLTYTKPGMGNDPANNWRSLGLDKLDFWLRGIRVSKNYKNQVIVEVDDVAEGIFQGENWYDHFSTAFTNHYNYTIDGSGEIVLEHTVTPQGLMPAWLPRMGVQWILDKSLEQVEWYGRGPFENYPDRKTGAKIGVYKSKVEDMKEKYLVPQDYGLRTDNRYVCIESAEGIGIRFSGSSLFNFNANTYSTDNMTRSRYPYQLQDFNGITFNFDYATSGVGCTAISVLNKYRVMPGEYYFVSHIKPYSTINDTKYR